MRRSNPPCRCKGWIASAAPRTDGVANPGLNVVVHGPPFARKASAASSSRSGLAADRSSMPARCARRGSRHSAADLAKLHREGRADVLIVSSGSIAPGRSRPERRAARCTEAGREPGCSWRGRTDRAGADLVGGARPSRYRRRADSGDLAGHRGTPPLASTRVSDHCEAFGMARGARDQRGTIRSPPMKSATATTTACRPRRHHGDAWTADPAGSDIDGLHDAPPAGNPNAKLVPVVETVTAEIEAICVGAAESGTVARRHDHQDRGRRRSRLPAAPIC